ncbi:MAG: 23S rRNA (pseudouridine(1915)-N(3))-methyltransferase RlmH [Candidatus Nanoarchaeia archaeon]|nr:23S rRNA (pseudouridine(1915)-N(3))-methyltransferase RlmH [Candidatus Nanoarchaeia archaeon]
MITLLCIGKLKNINFKTLFEDYFRRVKLFHKIELLEFKDSNKEDESKVVEDYIQNHPGKKYILLDEKGIQYDSTNFSKKIQTYEKNMDDVVFLIAGPTGFTDKFKAKFNDTFSLSKATFPHEMARVMLIEQIYRSFMILNNREYHK